MDGEARGEDDTAIPAAASTPALSDVESRLDALAEAVAALRRALPTADVTGRLSAQLDALPDTISARMGVEASTAALGLRIGGIGSALEQLRLAVQSGTEQATAKVDEPVWLPRLLVRIDGLDRAVGGTADAATAASGDLRAAVEALSTRLDTLETAVDESAGATDAILREQLTALRTTLDERTTAVDEALTTQATALRAALDDQATAGDERSRAQTDVLRSAVSDRAGTLEATLLDALADRTGAVETTLLGALAERSGAVETSLLSALSGRAEAVDAMVRDEVGRARSALDDRIGGVERTIVEALAVNERSASARADRLGQLVGERFEVVAQALREAAEAESAQRRAVFQRLGQVAERMEGLDLHVRTAADQAAADSRSAAEHLSDVAEAVDDLGRFVHTTGDGAEDRNAAAAAQLRALEQAVAGLQARADEQAGLLQGLDGQSRAILTRVAGPEQTRLADEVRTLATAVAQVVQGSTQEREQHAADLGSLRREVTRLTGMPDQLATIAAATQRAATAADAAGATAAAMAELRTLVGAPAEAIRSLEARVDGLVDRLAEVDRGFSDRLDVLVAAAETPPPAAEGAVAGDPAVAPALDGLAAATDDLAALVASTMAELNAQLKGVQHELTELHELPAQIATLDGRLAALEEQVAAGTAPAATLALVRAERAVVQARLEEERSRPLR